MGKSKIFKKVEVKSLKVLFKNYAQSQIVSSHVVTAAVKILTKI